MMLRHGAVLVGACIAVLGGGCATMQTFGSNPKFGPSRQSAWAPPSGHVIDCACNGGGPGTFSSEGAECQGEKYIPRIYSGFFYDASLLSRGGKSSVVGLMDAPFSFVFDTLLLPATVIQQAARGNICDGNGKKPEVDCQPADPTCTDRKKPASTSNST